MRVTWTTRDGRTHRVRLGLADYTLADLAGFREFQMLFQFCFAHWGGSWVPMTWIWKWFLTLHHRMQEEKDVLPFRYGADGDFGGGENVSIRGEWWTLEVGSGQCSLTFVNGRVTKWIDLRGETKLEVDGRTIKLQRKKQEYRWYHELPGLLRYFEGLPQDAEVRTWSVNTPVATREIIRIADEEPGGMETAVEILAEQGEKGRRKIADAAGSPRFAEMRATALQLLSLLGKRESARSGPGATDRPYVSPLG